MRYEEAVARERDEARQMREVEECVSAVRKANGVGKAGEFAGLSLNELEKRIYGLRESLAPVLCSSKPSPTREVTDPAPGPDYSTLAMNIYDIAARVSELNHAITDIALRLDL